MDPVVIWARAALLTAVTLFLGVAAHVTADGLLPSAAWLVVLALLGVVPCAALLAGPASTLRIVVLLAGGQALVHLALTVTAGHAGPAGHAGAGHTHPAGTPPHVDGAGSALQTLQQGRLAPTTGGVAAGDLVQHLVDHAPMMAAHVLAAALVGLWLAVGERALWTLVALAGALTLRPLLLLGALVRATRPTAVVAVLAHREPRAPAHRLLLARCVVRRGPPLLAI
jgi:hypothetical protein